MKGNFHVRFLGEGAAAMPLPYPTDHSETWKGGIPASLSRGFAVAVRAYRLCLWLRDFLPTLPYRQFLSETRFRPKRETISRAKL